MFYGLSDGPCMVPDSLNALPLDDANLPAASPKPQLPAERPAGSQKTRRQKNRRNKSKNVVAETAAEADEDVNEVDGAFNRLGIRDDGSTGFWAALGSSDSEFSDVEHGSSLSVSHSKRNSSARIRLHSLACFHAFIKVTSVLSCWLHSCFNVKNMYVFCRYGFRLKIYKSHVRSNLNIDNDQTLFDLVQIDALLLDTALL